MREEMRRLLPHTHGVQWQMGRLVDVDWWLVGVCGPCMWVSGCEAGRLGVRARARVRALLLLALLLRKKVMRKECRKLQEGMCCSHGQGLLLTAVLCVVVR